MSDSNEVSVTNVEEVTIKAEKPKNPKRVAWGKKLGEKNKGSRRKTEEIQESKAFNSAIYFAPVALAAVGIAAYVLYYSKSNEKTHEIVKRSPQIQKKKLNLEL